MALDPLVLTSHTWENGKNEQSHQDPSMAEAMLGELSHVSRVVFPADFNTAAAVMERLYQTQGQFWTLVIPKADGIPDLFTPAEAKRLMDDGGLRLDWAGHAADRAELILVAVGAYQLGEVLRASRRLTEREVPHGDLHPRTRTVPQPAPRGGARPPGATGRADRLVSGSSTVPPAGHAHTPRAHAWTARATARARAQCRSRLRQRGRYVRHAGIAVQQSLMGGVHDA
jgi:hypothetical protein